MSDLDHSLEVCVRRHIGRLQYCSLVKKALKDIRKEKIFDGAHGRFTMEYLNAHDDAQKQITLDTFHEELRSKGLLDWSIVPKDVSQIETMMFDTRRTIKVTSISSSKVVARSPLVDPRSKSQFVVKVDYRDGTQNGTIKCPVSRFHEPTIDDVSVMKRAAISYLRHSDSLMEAGRGWGFSPVFIDPLIEKYNLTHDAFASPFNAMTSEFFSLWPSVDMSCGNFLDPSTILPESMGCIACPPFTATLIDKAIDRALDALKEEGTERTFVFILPKWTDTRWWALLEKSEFLISHTHHESVQAWTTITSKAGVLQRFVAPAKYSPEVFVLSNEISS